jgi:hypothetical protein
VARDAAGNVATATTVTVTVNNVAGLVGAWGFEEGSGTTTADASGHGLTGTLTNATWSTAGKYGNALSFNGTNAMVTIADNALLHLTGAMTLEAWVRPTSLSAWRTILLKEAGTDESYAIYGNDDTNRPGGWAFVNGTYYSARGTAKLTNTTWTYLATTYDGTTLRMYVNGTLKASTAVSGNMLTSTGALRIGGNTIWGEYFNGLIDEVRVYNTSRTAAQVTTDMNTPVGGGSGAQLADRSAVTPRPTTTRLSAELVGPALAVAINDWRAAGVPAALLPAARAVTVHIADLPGSGLGFTDTASGQVWLDADAAGYGWSPAAGGFDLRTVLAHEVGHLLGIPDLPPDTARSADLMDQTIAPGEVRRPSALDVGIATPTAVSKAPTDSPAADPAALNGLAISNGVLATPPGLFGWGGADDGEVQRAAFDQKPYDEFAALQVVSAVSVAAIDREIGGPISITPAATSGENRVAVSSMDDLVDTRANSPE